MKKSIKFLAAALLIVCCLGVFAACKKHKHTYGTEWKYDAAQHWHECTGKGCAEKGELANHTFTDTTGTKPWLVNYAACVCGQTKATETDYTKMNNEEGLARLFTELTDNEGNLKINVDQKHNGRDIWKPVYEVNGKISYVIDTYESGNDWVTDYYYKSVIDAENNIGLQYYLENIDGAEWAVRKEHKMNFFFAWESWLWNEGGYHYVEAADFTLENGKYTATADNATYEITFNKGNIKLTKVVTVNSGADVYNTIYTITLGDCPTIVFPSEVQALHDTVMMFGIAPDEFIYNDNNKYEWVFLGVNKVAEFTTLLGTKGWTQCTDHTESGCNGRCNSWAGDGNAHGTYAEQVDNEMTVWFVGADGNGYQILFYKNA